MREIVHSFIYFFIAIAISKSQTNSEGTEKRSSFYCVATAISTRSKDSQILYLNLMVNSITK